LEHTLKWRHFINNFYSWRRWAVGSAIL